MAAGLTDCGLSRCGLMVTLLGRYVRLEPLSRDHVLPLVRAASGDRSGFAFTWVLATEAAMHAYVDTALDAYTNGTAVPFAVIDRRTDRVCGATRFGNIEIWARSPSPEEAEVKRRIDAAEIGWTWYAAAAQRTGINTEAKLLLLTHAFEVWRAHRIRLVTDARNIRSRTAIARLGAVEDGILRGDRPGADGSVGRQRYFPSSPRSGMP